MDLVNNIWDVALLFFWVFATIAYFFALISVITDLFRDRELSGGFKALWIVFLIFVPFLTVLVYLIARGGSMAERQVEGARQAQEATESYIKTVAGVSPSDEIAKAKTLLDSGTISAADFESLKARALAAQR